MGPPGHLDKFPPLAHCRPHMLCSFSDDFNSPLIYAKFVSRQNVEQPWYYGLVDYGFGLTAADGNEIQSEYFIPYANAVPAIKAVGHIEQ